MSKRVLIVSPHFPPTDLSDMHRVRVCSGWFSDFGWQVSVLAVAPESVSGGQDPELLQNIPADVRVERVSAFPENVLVRAIGFRAFLALWRKGRRMLKEKPTDLVFISTTAFPVMFLGYLWQRQLGVPYVLDFQDPWATYPETDVPFRTGLKARLARWIHGLMEKPSVGSAAGIVAVSQSYPAALGQRYGLRTPVLVQPFPYAASDYVLAGTGDRDTQSTIKLVFTGRVPVTMHTQFQTMLRLLKCIDASTSVAVELVGTSYSGEDNQLEALVVSSNLPENISVVVSPKRVSYLESIRLLMGADILLLFGSDDASYVPSKVQQYLAAAKPILLVASEESQVFKKLAPMPGVLTVDSDAEQLEDFSSRLIDLANYEVSEDEPRKGLLEAHAATDELSTFFDGIIDA